MPTLTSRHLVAVAFARGGDVVAHEAGLCAADAERLKHLVAGLAALGHVASYSISSAGTTASGADLVDVLRRRLGSLAVDAVLAAGPALPEPSPGFLAPVWPFDHELGGMPASTARFCGLDLELIATPSPDEELGARLPGREGRWLVHARPLLF